MINKTFFPTRASALALTAFLTAFTLIGCAPPEDLRGNNPDKKVMDSIKLGVTDKASITALLGSPSSVASFDANTWYYISQKTQNVAFFATRLNDEKVVSISFDKKGIVRKIAYLSMNDHQEIEPNPDKTPAPGREFTILEQLVGNFGRFSAPDSGGNGGGPNPNTGNH
jgi:outer membrane protein assembly factor BamE (lipoprotein component of BamABCDE complex)